MRTAAYLVVALAASALAAETAAAQAAAGTVRGRVTDRATGQGIVAAQVAVTTSAGVRVGGLTDNSGGFAVPAVPAGAVTVRALRIGYAPASQSVTVPASGAVEVTFALDKALTQLEAVVTTATGLQARREVGNVMTTLKADSIAAEAPVTNVTELLQARTPGVQIIQGNGNTGASPSIRIRGASSLSLTNEPLVIVDGVRVDNSAQLGGIGGVSTTRVNRLSAFNADDIESIDVVKGPSAAALYGTAAANGVLVIKTRRGAS
jgi:TonB-dependent starch-binding outer membrane protein SusC